MSDVQLRLECLRMARGAKAAAMLPVAQAIYAFVSGGPAPRAERPEEQAARLYHARPQMRRARRSNW